MKEKIRPHLYRMLSFLLPCSIMLLVFALNGKYPFGENALLESDAAAQYYPFLLLLRRTLREGGSLFYTWRAGLGTNLWALLAYYCINPWNLTALFLPESLIQGFLSLSVCVRIGLAGLFTAILMQTLSKKQSLAITVFASLYGLSLWFIWNYFQLIWLDAAALFPLMLAGLVRLVRDGHCKMFIAVLLLSLICNPYFSFITCVMTFCCWLCLLIILKKPLRTVPREAGRFFGSALLSGGMAAVILIPLAFAVRTTGSAGQTMPGLLTFPYSVPALLGRLVSFTYPIQHIGLPNLSGSMIGVLLFTGYLTAKRIPLRERLTVGGLLLFLLFSLWYPPLNYLWHGMHIPNGFIHRFAFLVPFVLLMAGWRFTETLDEADNIPLWKRLMQLGGMAVVTAGICVCGAATAATDVVVLSAVLVLLYMALYIWRYIKPVNELPMCVILLMCVCTEEFCSANMAVGFLPVLYQASDLTEQPEIAEAAAAIREDTGDKPQRTASAMGHGFNPELFSDLPYGGTLYSSLIPASLLNTLSELGMYSGTDQNRYFYCPLSPVSVLLTDLRYVIAPDGSGEPEAFYEALGDTCAKRFRYDLPFGFCIPEQLDFPADELCPERQNRLFRQIADTDVCRILPAELTAPDAEISGSADGKISCKTGDDPRTTLTYRFTADADGSYIYDIWMDESLCPAIKRYDLIVDGETKDVRVYKKDELFQKDGSMLTVGELQKGQKIEIVLVFREHSAGDLQVQAARLDADAFAEGLQKLDAYSMQDVQVQDTEITGTVTASDTRTLLYLPVPYDKGWKAEIDGQSAELTEAMPGMIGVRLSAGTHSIRLHYRPQGFAAGCAVSLFSLMLCMVLLLRRRTDTNRSEET